MIRRRLTYGNVVATLALVLALGGASALAAGGLAKNSVGTRQLRRNAVTGVKVKDGSLGGADIDAASLGKVPAAIHADNAVTADTATRAVNADHATRADGATSAARATTAGDAETLAGKSSSQIIAAATPSCPAGTKLEFGLCFETVAQPPADLFPAISDCTMKGRWLPDVEQIIAFQAGNSTGEQPEEWSDVIYRTEGKEWGYVAHVDATGSSIGPADADLSKAYRCVVAPQP